MKEFKLSTDLFSIPYGEKFIIYAPLRRIVFLANKPAVEFLNKMEGDELSKEEIEGNYEILGRLEQAGIINNHADSIPSEIKNNRFLPTYITIIPTTDCNLRCVYCYATAGDKIKNMDWGIAKAGIDLSISSALKLKKKSFSLGFHGGGEPTLRWKLLRKCIDYAKQMGNDNSLKPRFSIVTNGVLTEHQANFIGQNINSILVSVDGPKDIQDRQRPKSNGHGSSEEVFTTLKRLDELGIRYGIRSTITEYSVNRMTEIIDFFHQNFHNVIGIQFEPLFGCGRSISSRWKAPSNEAFIKNYIKAKKKADRYHLKLRYSGSDLSRVSIRFCGAAGNNCYVTPDGFISSCIEVTSEDDPRSKLFFYGKFNKKTSEFDIDKKQLMKLRNMIVQNMWDCQKCFLKWNCAGDCLAKRFYQKGEKNAEGPRCEINRLLAFIRLKELLDAKKFVNSDALHSILT